MTVHLLVKDAWGSVEGAALRTVAARRRAIYGKRRGTLALLTIVITYSGRRLTSSGSITFDVIARFVRLSLCQNQCDIR